MNFANLGLLPATLKLQEQYNIWFKNDKIIKLQIWNNIFHFQSTVKPIPPLHTGHSQTEIPPRQVNIKYWWNEIPNTEK